MVRVLVPSAAFGLTIKEEETLSKEVLKTIRQRFELVEDPVILEYINSLGRKLLDQAPPQPFEYHFYVIREPVYNAFATPAGHIFIYTGLLEAMESEDELAGILAHEIAHVTSRHISQKIERAKKISLATLAGIAAGALLGAGGAAVAGQAVTAGAMAAGQSFNLAYSREDEIQADQLGLQYLTRAGYDGRALMKILNKIREKQWFGGLIPTYLSTHPAAADRIAYIDAHMAAADQRPAALLSEKSLEFVRIHTRIVAQYGDEASALKRLADQVKEEPGNPMAHYGYGLILDRVGRREEAVEHLKTALDSAAFNPVILAELGRVYFLEGRFEDALNVLEGAVMLAPDRSETLFYLGRTMLALNRPAEARRYFNTLLERFPRYTEAHFFYGKALHQAGLLGEAHYHLGLYYRDKEEFDNAAFQFKQAAEKLQDPEKKEEIKEILKTLNQEKAEKRKDEAEKKAGGLSTRP